MHRTATGQYVTTTTVGDTVRDFVPRPLPPMPPIDWTMALRERYDQALPG
jgi:hypothetical protein